MKRLLLITLVCLVPTQAQAAIQKEPQEHHCYAVASALGSKPVEVPCSPPQTPPSSGPTYTPTEPTSPPAAQPDAPPRKHRPHRVHRSGKEAVADLVTA